MTFDYNKFNVLVDNEYKLYNKKKPYPYAIFDDLFDDDVLIQLNKEIDETNFKKDNRIINNIEVKTRSDFEDNESLPFYTKKIFDVLNGGKFLNILSTLTNINGLISDPYFDGGGVNIIKNNGTLAVHVDGTHQQRMNVSRRINVILFLNKNWDKNWNGYHEQWDYINKSLSPFDENQEWRCIRKIYPKFNRLYVFTTNDHSWHGHAGVLKIPEEIERRSVISYYYTSNRPESDLIYESPHRALFINNNITLKGNPYSDVEIIY